MNAFGEHVGREHQRFAVAEGQYGAVVADAFEAVCREGGEKFPDAVYESEFGHGCPTVFAGIPAGRRTAKRVTTPKSSTDRSR